ncbi:2TM domain-containing protein [Flagellimonas meridianipacifica]|uniref:2TM domain-containing protein n=1 Tax=Flagellimonas meridianipacifica TaxID=1080225 RepID=A0A2T0MAX8_9FLAO|nr:2TM domain-containing protein [Allomuricauda pacifica]
MVNFTLTKKTWRFKKRPLFFAHLFFYLVITSGLVAINLIFTPERVWSKWIILLWGFAVLLHELAIFFVNKKTKHL